MEILIADDDVVSSRVLRAALRRRGHDTTVAVNGEEAWGLLQRRHFPILISDWLMPGMDGLELCRRVRGRAGGQYTYVILLTARSAREHRLEGLEAGADDFLTKPVDLGELSARLGIARRILTMQQDLHERSVETGRLNDQLRQQNEQLSNTLCFLEAANHRFSELFEGLPVACYSYDAEGVIHEWNRAAADLFGYGVEETFGRPLGEILGRGEGTPAPPDAGGPAGVEVQTRTRSGRHLHLLSKTIPLRAPGGQIVGMISAEMDITDRRRLEEQLVTQLSQMTALNAELEQFASIASHDLQEPLRKIQTFGGRLRRQYAHELGEQGGDYLNRMDGAACRMQSLIRDLFALSQVTSQEHTSVPVDAHGLLRDVLGDLETRMEETGGRVEVGEMCPLSGDPLQLRQLLQNLIGNSLKYHRPGIPPVVRVRAVRLPRERLGQEVCQIRIADNGIGFAPEYTDRIFAPFQRLHGRGQYDGTGIGLAICRKIVERHGGTINADSRPGEGATFIVDLPGPAGTF